MIGLALGLALLSACVDQPNPPNSPDLEGDPAPDTIWLRGAGMVSADWHPLAEGDAEICMASSGTTANVNAPTFSFWFHFARSPGKPWVVTDLFGSIQDTQGNIQVFAHGGGTSLNRTETVPITGESNPHQRLCIGSDRLQSAGNYTEGKLLLVESNAWTGEGLRVDVRGRGISLNVSKSAEAYAFGWADFEAIGGAGAGPIAGGVNLRKSVDLFATGPGLMFFAPRVPDGTPTAPSYERPDGTKHALTTTWVAEWSDEPGAWTFFAPMAIDTEYGTMPVLLGGVLVNP